MVRMWLMKGHQGDDVRRLQYLLNRKLSPSPRLTVDGIFGNKTAAAVRRFQKLKELEVDGVAGKNTWRALGVSWTPIPHTPKYKTESAVSIEIGSDITNYKERAYRRGLTAFKNRAPRLIFGVSSLGNFGLGGDMGPLDEIYGYYDAIKNLGPGTFLEQGWDLLKNTYKSLSTAHSHYQTLGKIRGYADTMARLVHKVPEHPQGTLPSLQLQSIPSDMVSHDSRWNQSYQKGAQQLMSVLSGLDVSPDFPLHISAAELFVIEFANRYKKGYIGGSRAETRKHILNNVLGIQYQRLLWQVKRKAMK